LIANGWRSWGGVFQDMKIVPFLIFWSLPLLQTGGTDPSSATCRTGASYAEPHVNSAVIQKTRGPYLPDDPGGGSLGSSLWDEDEEDSVEDMFFDTGILLSGSLRNLGRDDLSSLIRAGHDLFRLPSHPHPLRC
jgi:hypothetical protein